MKKLLSIMLVCVMVLAMSTTMVFADAINYLMTADKTSLQPGDVVTLTVKLDANPGIAYYKNIVSFDATAFERTTITYVNSDDEEVTEEVKSSWGAPTINDGQAGKTIMTWANSSNKTGKTVLTMCYVVKATAVNGADYNFTIECEQAKNASGAEVVINSSTVSAIEITGGVEAGGNDEVTAEKAEGADYNTYTFENLEDGSVLAGKKVLMQKAAMPTSGITADTRFVVSNGTRTQIFGGDIWEKLGAEGDGVVDVANVIFGLIVDATSTDAFTFSVQ